MKKVLLLIISLFVNLCLGQAVFAYQTVLIDFPQNQGWHPVCYDTQGDETILQYVPVGQNEQSWVRAVIFHSYKNLSWTNSAAKFMDRITQQMELKNPTQSYRYTKYTDADSIATRCVKKTSSMAAQCEIYRVSQSFEGLISMHYINRNISDFKNSYDMWYQIMQNVRIYYSYYMDDRILDKATSFEM